MKEVSLLLGSWLGENNDARYEERWFPKLGTAMLGTFRQIKNDGAELYELQILKVEEGQTFLYLRHFDGRFIGWEAKESPMKFSLVLSDSDRLLFKNTASGKLQEIEYRLDENVLTASLRGTDGTDLFSFVYLRQNP